MTEIERKFLVKSNEFKSLAFEQKRIIQGFLNSHPNRTVRVRITGEKAYLTVKGKSSENGLSRYEWEKEIPVNEAEELLELCEEGQIEKVRYLVSCGDHIYEVDDFLGDNEGLQVAEIELANEHDNFEKPSWLGEEVTGDVRYYNSLLSNNPYKNWKIT